MGDAETARQLFERGTALHDQGDVAGAESTWHEASMQGDSYGARAACLSLGDLLHEQGRLDEAGNEWNYAAEADDPEIGIPATINYARLIGNNEFNHDALVGRHRYAKSVGGYDVPTADRLWRRAAESEHPDAAWAWIGLGRLYDPTELADEPDPAKSLQAFETAASSQHPDAAPCALFKLGRLQESLGRQERGGDGALDGLAALERGAGTRHPQWAPSCAFQLAGIYADQGDLVSARPWWEMVASSDQAAAEHAQKALKDLDSGGANPLDDVDTLFTLEANDARALDAFDFALQSLGWQGGLEDAGSFSHTRRERNPYHLYCLPRKRLLSGGGRIEVYVKQTDGEESSVGLAGGSPKDRNAFQRAIRSAASPR